MIASPREILTSGGSPDPETSLLGRNSRRLSALLVLIALDGCSGGEAPQLRPPDLVLISLDTLRADLLELTRADGSPEMPTLRRLAEESIWFDNAWAPQPFTLPSHMTMLTGLHPETHGVVAHRKRLAAGVPTLAERLRAAGYRTVGVTCGPWLERGYGFARGFDDYRGVSLDLTFAPRVRARALGALAALPADDRPRFLFAHFYDAHGDWPKRGNRLSYLSPPEFRTDLEVASSTLCSDADGCAIPYLLALSERGENPGAEFARTHFELYRRGARALDAELALFIEQLRGARIWDDALVIVTADHGEEFGEHSGFVHEQIFRETLRVPLLVKLPNHEAGGRREHRPVALEDIAPTLLARAGVAHPPELLGFDLLAPPRSGSPRPIVARQSARKERFALRLGNRLLVRDRAVGERRLFDLVTDPLELVELVADPGELAALDERLESALRKLRAGRLEAANDGAPLDAGEAADLRALGYLN